MDEPEIALAYSVRMRPVCNRTLPPPLPLAFHPITPHLHPMSPHSYPRLVDLLPHSTPPEIVLVSFVGKPVGSDHQMTRSRRSTDLAVLRPPPSHIHPRLAWIWATSSQAGPVHARCSRGWAEFIPDWRVLQRFTHHRRTVQVWLLPSTNC
jgi:hypothetical protein